MWIEPHVIRHRRSRLFINMTSMVDVLFILLIFLFLSTSFNRYGTLDVSLPSAKTGESKETSVFKVHEITLYGPGDYALDGKKMGAKELLRAVKDWSSLEKDSPVLLKADEKIPYGEVVRLLDRLRELGVMKIEALTRGE